MAQHEEARNTLTPVTTSGTSEVVVKGIAAAPGIAIGPVYVFAKDLHPVEERALDADLVESEVRRFEEAVIRAEADLAKITSLAMEKLGRENASIFEAQAMMLRDEELYDAVVDDIMSQRVNADFAVSRALTRHRRRLEASDSEYIRERSNDLLDLQERLIRHLRRGSIISEVRPDTIVIAETVSASDIVQFSRRGILGCATEFGGPTSHVSIMARALDVPAVVSAQGITDLVTDGDTVIVDGIRGEIIVRPVESTLAVHRSRKRRFEEQRIELKRIVGLPSESRDGRRVLFKANLEFKEELPSLKRYGAEGIGLFRTEIVPLMQRRMSISEEEQFRMCRHIIRRVAPEPTVIRILDLGGDKMLPLGHREYNPFLGWRGIRVLLDKPDLLLPQLRAILRASVYGPTSILLPMVSTIQEVRQFKNVLSEVKSDLRRDEIEYSDEVPIGIMVEVPSVALMADVFAREVDFLSIGTNDLTQYTLAVDRGNDLVADRYQEIHPAVLRLIKMTIDAGNEAGIPVAICGELAGNPEAAALLFGLGLREFSASPVYLPAVKRIIRSITVEEAQELAQQALSSQTTDDVRHLLKKWHEAHPQGLLSFLPNMENGTPV